MSYDLYEPITSIPKPTRQLTARNVGTAYGMQTTQLETKFWRTPILQRYEAANAETQPRHTS
jgi:hypothetical protein